MYNKLRKIIFLPVVFAFFCFFLTEAQVSGATKGLKVQLVLEARNERVTIPYDIADQVVDHLSQTIKEAAFTSVLRGDDKIILTFFSPLSCKEEIGNTISSIKKLPSAGFIKIGTWKQEETELPPEIVFEAKNSQTTTENSLTTTEKKPPEPVKTKISKTKDGRYVRETSYSKSSNFQEHIKFKFILNEKNLLDIEAMSVPLGMLLESMASSSDFQYICPQTIGRRELSINCKSVSVSSLLAALKLSLNLSIKKTGKIVTFVDG